MYSVTFICCERSCSRFLVLNIATELYYILSVRCLATEIILYEAKFWISCLFNRWLFYQLFIEVFGLDSPLFCGLFYFVEYDIFMQLVCCVYEYDSIWCLLVLKCVLVFWVFFFFNNFHLFLKQILNAFPISVQTYPSAL
jgi:hypothetical protein